MDKEKKPMPPSDFSQSILRADPFDQLGLVRAIIETPKGSFHKYKFMPDLGLFECGVALNAGLAFPIDFGFIPSTKADDGDPLDIMVLLDAPTFPGCLVHTRVIGVLEAEQREPPKPFVRNDRLIGVHDKSIEFANVASLSEISKNVTDKLVTFFELYNKARGREFRSFGWKNYPKRLILFPRLKRNSLSVLVFA
jgi:inorganic pyrophosphatase